MQDMISKIVEMDEKAQELTAEAQKKKADSQQEISKAKEDIYNDFITRARKHIADIQTVEAKAAEERFEESKIKQDELLKKLNQKYAENGDGWVDTIVKNVLA